MTTTDHETLDQKPAIQTITFGIGTCTFGLALVAATSRGICAILLGSNEKALANQLRSIFPHATMRKAGKQYEEALSHVVEYIETPTGTLSLPLDIRGTAFQKQIWNALEEIPAGQTVTYKELALKLGATAQEIGEACAANVHAVVIPCHRVVRSDGGIAGYRWGVNRKRLLLQREQEMFPDPQSLWAYDAGTSRENLKARIRVFASRGGGTVRI